MTLESRASRAVRSLKSSVAKAALPAGIGSIVHRRRFDRIGAFAFTLLIVALIGSAVYALPGVVGGDDVASETSVATTLGDTTSSMPGSTPVFVGGGEESSGEGGAFEPTGYCPPWAECEPGDTTVTTEEKPQDGVFTAYQKYSSSDANPPKSYYYGTGEPGTTIWVGSYGTEYGSATTTVNENGEWAVWVEFPSAPACTSFTVKAHDVPWTVHQAFTFTRWGDGCESYTFTAHQETNPHANPPVGEYWGTGEPGTILWIGHYPNGTYGWTQVEVGPDGKWDARIEYDVSGAYCDQGFTVKVHDVPWTEYIAFTFTPKPGSGCTVFTASPVEYASSDPCVAYTGTGIPGDAIWVGHYPDGTYGSNTTTVQANGTWATTVCFNGAPIGTQISVKARNDCWSVYKHLYFTRLEPEPPTTTSSTTTSTTSTTTSTTSTTTTTVPE